MRINMNSILAKIFLHYNPFSRVKVMCLGYNEDYECFTELIWEDDKDLDFSDKDTYPNFQLWYL